MPGQSFTISVLKYACREFLRQRNVDDEIGQHMWGRGYFCGAVGEVDEKTIRNYIENQGKLESGDEFTIVEDE